MINKASMKTYAYLVLIFYDRLIFQYIIVMAGCISTKPERMYNDILAKIQNDISVKMENHISTIMSRNTLAETKKDVTIKAFDDTSRMTSSISTKNQESHFGQRAILGIN